LTAAASPVFIHLVSQSNPVFKLFSVFYSDKSTAVKNLAYNILIRMA